MPTRQDANLAKGDKIRVICAPDSFKESIQAPEVAAAMAKGINKADFGIICDQCPIADGGEGSLDALLKATNGVSQKARVIGPQGDQIEAQFGVTPDGLTGIVELAQASGLSLIPKDKRDPTRTTTYGVGQLIAAATDLGCKNIILCIGGSATVDCGIGIIQGMGGKFFDKNGKEIKSPITGNQLHEIYSYEQPKLLPEIRVACDVTNPLLGPNGAATIFGPQKGATPRQVELLEDALARIASLTDKDPQMKMAGAAGGAGFGLNAFCSASLESGIDLILGAVDFNNRCAKADLVLTGEGCLDRQSLLGKASMGVAKAAHKLGIPCIAIVGKSGAGAEESLQDAKGGALKSYYSLEKIYGIDRALNETSALIKELTAEIITAQLIHQT